MLLILSGSGLGYLDADIPPGHDYTKGKWNQDVGKFWVIGELNMGEMHVVRPSFGKSNIHSEGC